eukprot:COSAG01_NODE_50285_length_364_cov_1.494340_1_plen_41_part_01
MEMMSDSRGPPAQRAPAQPGAGQRHGALRGTKQAAERAPTC